MLTIPTTKEVVSYVENSAKELGTTAARIIRLSDVSSAAWIKWKHDDATPQLRTVERVFKTIEKLKSK
jgi:hypothetical protein